jgi:hypothetical protein
MLKLGLALCGAETGTGFVGAETRTEKCELLKVGLALCGDEIGTGFVWC